MASNIPTARGSTNRKNPATPKSLADILEGCRVRDRDAQRTLYERYQPRVYRLMVRMVGVEDAADLTQQTFLQLFLKLDQFAGRSHFDTWLYRLSFNEALQFLRKARRSRYSPLTHEPMSPSQAHERYDDKELLEQAMALLDPELRSIFVLREIEELSYGQIAAALDIPEGTVGSRLNRARAELQRHLVRLGWKK